MSCDDDFVLFNKLKLQNVIGNILHFDQIDYTMSSEHRKKFEQFRKDQYFLIDCRNEETLICDAKISELSKKIFEGFCKLFKKEPKIKNIFKISMKCLLGCLNPFSIILLPYKN